MPRRRIPPWVVIVLFAAVVGTGIGALAYLRAPAARPISTKGTGSGS